MIDTYSSRVNSFISNFDALQSRIDQLNQKVTSGTRVSSASDDPSAVQPILALQANIARVTQIQTNLTLVKTDVSSADSGLQTTMDLLNRVMTLATQASSTTTSSSVFSSSATEVRQIRAQLVGIANTSVNGRYVFGGDASQTAPYALSNTSATGVQSTSSAGNTKVIEDASGNELNPLPTAQQIFDDQDANGAATSSNVFQMLSNLATAMDSGDSTQVAAVLTSVKDSQSHVSSALASVGASETWITQATSDAAAKLVNWQQQLSSLRDTDEVSAMSALSLAQTAREAALTAEGQAPRNSLFSYLG